MRVPLLLVLLLLLILLRPVVSPVSRWSLVHVFACFLLFPFCSGMSRPRRKDSGHKRKMKISNRHSFVLKVAVESIMIFAAEWFSLEEMKALQGVCVLASVWAREWQCKDIPVNFDDQVWTDLSEEWQKVRVRKRRKSCPVMTPLCPGRCPNY